MTILNLVSISRLSARGKMPVSCAIEVAPTTTSFCMASWIVRTGVEAFQTAPIETVREGLPIQLNCCGAKFACGSLSSGASMKPRVMKPQAVPSCGPTLSI